MSGPKVVLAVVAGALFLGGAVAVIRTADRAPAQRLGTPLGDTLPWVALKTPDGAPINLHHRLHGRPALIYVFNEAECASCSNLPLEFQIIRRQAPAIQPLLIGSGAPPSAFAPHIHQMGVDSAVLIDEERSLLRALGVASEPLVLLIDPTGRVVFADTRSAPKAAQYPMGRILHDIQSMLGPAGAAQRP